MVVVWTQKEWVPVVVVVGGNRVCGGGADGKGVGSDGNDSGGGVSGGGVKGPLVVVDV